MTTCHCIGENDSWGYGVRVITKGQDEYLPEGCFGWSGAYGTHFWVDPLNEIIGIYFKNSSYDGGSGAMTSRNFEKDVYSQKGY
jgi:CubicO group peptidase (beta-lactamase class C family)